MAILKAIRDSCSEDAVIHKILRFCGFLNENLKNQEFAN